MTGFSCAASLSSVPLLCQFIYNLYLASDGVLILNYSWIFVKFVSPQTPKNPSCTASCEALLVWTNGAAVLAVLCVP